jgi:DNA modification methylase
MKRCGKGFNSIGSEEASMAIIQGFVNTSDGSYSRKPRRVAASGQATSHEPDLSHIAPGLRPLAVRIAELTPMLGNPRLHPVKNLDAIKAALLEYGQVEPILVNRRKQPWEVVHGNGRLEAGLELGWEYMAATIIDVDEVTAKAMTMVLNRTGELAEWNKEELDKLLREVQTSEKLTAMLAELAQEQGIPWNGTAGLTDPDEIPEPPDKPVTRRNDLWILGPHRVLCGDSSEARDVDRLVDGATIDLLITDPPYNVRVEPRSNNAITAGLSSFQAGQRHQARDRDRPPKKAKPTRNKMRARDRPLENDFLSEEQFTQKLREWFGNAARVLKPGGSMYVFGGYANVANYPPVFKEAGLYFSQAIIWHKMQAVLTRKDYMGDHEWCFYGWKEGAAHQFFGPPNVTDVWSVKKVNPQNMVHLTEKPVELAMRAMSNSSRVGENVLDLFGGSGSTLIAAEQTGRRAYLMEIDPSYVDVIVQRYEAFSGCKGQRRAAR